METRPENLKQAFETTQNEARSGFSGAKEPVLSMETLASLQELGTVLQGIRRRMKAEGFEIVNGAVRKIT